MSDYWVDTWINGVNTTSVGGASPNPASPNWVGNYDPSRPVYAVVFAGRGTQDQLFTQDRAQADMLGQFGLQALAANPTYVGGGADYGSRIIAAARDAVSRTTSATTPRTWWAAAAALVLGAFAFRGRR